jgi:hypothetical protein
MDGITFLKMDFIRNNKKNALQSDRTGEHFFEI